MYRILSSLSEYSAPFCKTLPNPFISTKSILYYFTRYLTGFFVLHILSPASF